jgi:5-(carboxyamino)imidazole ribonucleotide synthase
MKAFNQNLRLGILGGGQLGRMLIPSCHNLNLHTRVLDPAANAPCKGVATEFTQGSLTDFDSVYHFGKSVDLLTIEIENVNVQALHQLEAEGLPVYPQPRVIELIKDKRTQKQFYRQHGIPTADFVLVENRADIEKHADFLPAFNKLGTGGYDGGGVQRLDSPADISKGFDRPGLLEKTIDFDREISVIVARNQQGEIAVFPPVECVFDPRYNLVDYLLSPSSAAPAILQAAESLARQVIEAFAMVGVLAVEMFVTKAGELLVNEVAPRPHNSGHQTLCANHVSQYEQHLRAILGLPLGDTSLKSPSAMVNVLGAPGHSGPAHYQGMAEVLAIAGTNVVLYGKQETRPARKMGHVTILDSNLPRLLAKVQQVKQTLKVISE